MQIKPGTEMFEQGITAVESGDGGLARADEDRPRAMTVTVPHSQAVDEVAVVLS